MTEIIPSAESMSSYLWDTTLAASCNRFEVEWLQLQDRITLVIVRRKLRRAVTIWVPLVVGRYSFQFRPSESPRPRIGLDTRIGTRAQHTRLRIHDDAGVGPHRPRRPHVQLMAAIDELLLRCFGDSVLELQVARNHGVRERRCWEAACGPP